MNLGGLQPRVLAGQPFPVLRIVTNSGAPKAASGANTQGVASTQTWSLNTEPPPAPPQMVETSTVDFVTTTYDWTWGDSSSVPSSKTPLLESESQPSLVVLNQKRVRLYQWDTATNFLKGVLQSGFTREYTANGWQTVEKFIGTFYKTTGACGGPADSLGRAVEIHGPCFVQAKTSTECDLPQSFAIRSFIYDTNSPHHLSQTRVYPNASRSSGGTLTCGNSLQTTYSQYSQLGQPTLVVGADGVSTSFAYHPDGRVQSLTRGNAQWSYFYDGDKLTAVHSPDGYWKTWCYRPYTASGGCDFTGAMRTKPSAYAISASNLGTNPSEFVIYEYAPDGTLISVSVRDSEGQQRLVNLERDPSGNLTFSGLGQGAVGGSQMSLFDSAGRLRGTSAPGHPNAPAFCGGASSSGAPLSSECLAFEYRDRQVTRAMGGGIGDTALTYHAGHLLDVTSESASGNPKLRLEYEYDDFGNTLKTKTHTELNQTLINQMAYDAQGNVIRRQNPEMIAAGAVLESEFDGLGRLLRVSRRVGANADVLLRQEWDAESAGSCATCPAITTACIANNQRGGRLAYREDAVGETWFNYDIHGNINAEIVRERYASDCSAARSRRYSYSHEGELTAIDYPFGRKVLYNRSPGLRRPTSISTMVLKSSGWTEEVTLVDGIMWEPFGGIRYYRVWPNAGASEPITVDYRAGQTSAGFTSPAFCNLIDGFEDSDFTGRIRTLMVKRGSSTASYQDRLEGNHVFSTSYAYAEGSQLRQRLSCLLSDAQPVLENFEFNNGFLTAARRWLEPNHDPLPGRRSYDLGISGTGTTGPTPWREVSTISMDFPHQQWTSDPAYRSVTTTEYGYQVDFVEPNISETLRERRTVGANGQVVERRALQSGGYNLWKETLNGAIASGNTGGLESVYQSVETEAGFFEYYYDGTNRRRLKVYPSGNRDEFFFRPGSHELLVDVGNDELYSPASHPVDEYVWLDGKPVVIIRGLLDSNYTQLDDPTECGRNGTQNTPSGVTVGSACGQFFPVTDPQGRIAVMLDDEARVSGVGESEPYGGINQVELIAATDHPYSPYYHLQFPPLLGDFHIQAWAHEETEIRSRVHFFGVDIEETNDAWLEDGETANTLTSALDFCWAFGSNCGPKMGRVTTPWVESYDYGHGPMHLKFRSGPSKPVDYWGVAADRIEYLRSERDAKAWWPSLRLPGQYLDEETGLFENWNRFYDPAIGRYLSPEPLLQSPNYVRMMAQSGHSVPTYAYALNNPIGYVDRDGRFVMFAPAAGYAIAAAFGLGVGLGVGASYLMPQTSTLDPRGSANDPAGLRPDQHPGSKLNPIPEPEDVRDYSDLVCEQGSGGDNKCLKNFADNISVCRDLHLQGSAPGAGSPEANRAWAICWCLAARSYYFCKKLQMPAALQVSCGDPMETPYPGFSR